ncbi:ThuA domain-containing protein [Thalassotalea piscium]
MKINRCKIILLVCLSICSSLTFAQQFNVLLFTKTMGWHHKSIPAGVANLKYLADKHHFNMDWQEDPSYLNDKYLANIDVVIFMMTTGDILNEKQQGALKRFINSGKGFVGIHSASDTEANWPWYQKLVGRSFIIHPITQTAKLQVVNSQFPGMNQVPNNILWTDEWYDFGPELSKNLNYLLTVDESTYDTHSDWGNNKKGNGMGEFHPIAWYQEFDGGRSFYTSLGHLNAVHTNPIFQAHLFGGIFWAATGKGISN